MPASAESGPQSSDPAAGSGSLRGTRVEVTNLTVSAGDRTLLQDTSVTFPAGELILLLGWSGVGKSVLLRILAGLIDSSHTGSR